MRGNLTCLHATASAGFTSPEMTGQCVILSVAKNLLMFGMSRRNNVEEKYDLSCELGTSTFWPVLFDKKKGALLLCRIVLNIKGR